MFQDSFSMLSSFSECVGSGVCMVSSIMFVMMTVVDFLWTTSSGGQFRFLEGPVGFPLSLVFRHMPGHI